MADEKKLTNEEIKNEELTDEQANKAAGGTYQPFARCRDTCYLCGESERIENMTFIVINGERVHVCYKCV